MTLNSLIDYVYTLMQSIMSCTHAVTLSLHCIISTDTSITIANLSAALATLNDEDLAEACGVPDSKREQFRNQSTSNEEYRRLSVEYFVFVFFIPSWEWLAGWCFYLEEDRALNEVKEHVQRKLGMLLIHNCCRVNN